VPAKPAAVAKAPAAPAKDQKPAPAKPAPAAAKAAAPAKPAAKVIGAAQKLPAKKEAAKPAVAAAPAAKKTAGHYTLAIGTYVLEKSMAADKAKLKKAGLAPAVKKGDMKQEPMTRLYLATYPNYDEAAAALKQLRQSSGDGFFLPEGDRYAVYAGSYFQESRAAVEQDRLSGKGIKTVMRKVKVPVPTYRMTAGSFSTREDAVQAVARLKKSGIRAAVIRLK
jgi:cell division protein FtsN